MATPQKPRLTLGKDKRLKGKALITKVYETGKKRTHHPLVAHVLGREDSGPTRLGISIGRRCGNAVERNLIKRRIKEAFRQSQHHLPPGRDVLLVIRPHKALTVVGYQEKIRAVVGG